MAFILMKHLSFSKRKRMSCKFLNNSLIRPLRKVGFELTASQCTFHNANRYVIDDEMPRRDAITNGIQQTVSAACCSKTNAYFIWFYIRFGKGFELMQHMHVHIAHIRRKTKFSIRSLTFSWQSHFSSLLQRTNERANQLILIARRNAVTEL